MKTLAYTLIALCLAAVFAMPASALPQDCDVKCGPTTPSWIVCACGWGFEVTTCGEWFDNYCGMLLTQDPKPSDVGLPNTVLTDLGIVSYAR